MIPPSDLPLLRDIIRREQLSLLSYVGDAFPWTARHDDPALRSLHELVLDHRSSINTLTGMFHQRRITLPRLGSYPASFTNFNFLSLDYIVGRLRSLEHAACEQLASEISRIQDVALVKDMENYLSAKRMRLARLESLAAGKAKSEVPMAS